MRTSSRLTVRTSPCPVSNAGLRFTIARLGRNCARFARKAANGLVERAERAFFDPDKQWLYDAIAVTVIMAALVMLAAQVVRWLAN